MFSVKTEENYGYRYGVRYCIRKNCENSEILSKMRVVFLMFQFLSTITDFGILVSLFKDNIQYVSQYF